MRFVICGLSITSSWGNGHATTYRGLIQELAARGHDILFLERDVPWYAKNRDLADPKYCRVGLYSELDELRDRFGTEVRRADVVMVGSYVPEGVAVGKWVTATAGGLTAFYDIDTPVTLAKLRRGDHEYIAPELIPRYHLYLSFTGGPSLARLRGVYGSPKAEALYCSVDPKTYYPEGVEHRWELGYLGTYSNDRQPKVEALLLEPARSWTEGRFAVAGPMYPESIEWPANVDRIEHLAPPEHRRFYNAQKFTLNVTRADMVRAGYSPSVRLFEAAACGTPIISDYWDGLETIFSIGEEILIARSTREAVRYLWEMKESERRAIGGRAMKRILRDHTAQRRAAQLEAYVVEAGMRHTSIVLASRTEPRRTHYRELGRLQREGSSNGRAKDQTTADTREAARHRSRDEAAAEVSRSEL
jgi:spore maturation protein CgeB